MQYMGIVYLLSINELILWLYCYYNYLLTVTNTLKDFSMKWFCNKTQAPWSEQENYIFIAAL